MLQQSIYHRNRNSTIYLLIAFIFTPQRIIRRRVRFHSHSLCPVGILLLHTCILQHQYILFRLIHQQLNLQYEKNQYQVEFEPGKEMSQLYPIIQVFLWLRLLYQAAFGISNVYLYQLGVSLYSSTTNKLSLLHYFNNSNTLEIHLAAPIIMKNIITGHYSSMYVDPKSRVESIDYSLFVCPLSYSQSLGRGVLPANGRTTRGDDVCFFRLFLTSQE